MTPYLFYGQNTKRYFCRSTTTFRKHQDMRNAAQRDLEVSLLAETYMLSLQLGFDKDSSKIAQQLGRNQTLEFL